MYRLTVHLENVQKVDAVIGKKKNDKGKWVDQTKRKIYNTKSQVCKTKADCEKLLSDWRSKYNRYARCIIKIDKYRTNA